MAVENRHLSQPLEAAREVDLLRGIKRFVESAQLAKGRGAAEDERAGRPVHRAAYPVPHPHRQPCEPIVALHLHRAAATQDFSAFQETVHLQKKRPAGKRIRIDKDQPFASSVRCAGVARAGDLVDGLEDHGRTRIARDFGGAVGRVVVADDQLDVAIERAGGRADAAQRFAQQLFFVEGRDDDRKLQPPRAQSNRAPAMIAGSACTQKILRLTVAAPYAPATITQARKKNFTASPGAPSHSPHARPAARKPLYRHWLAASVFDAAEYSGVMPKLRRP